MSRAKILPLRVVLQQLPCMAAYLRREFPDGFPLTKEFVRRVILREQEPLLYYHYGWVRYNLLEPFLSKADYRKLMAFEDKTLGRWNKEYDRLIDLKWTPAVSFQQNRYKLAYYKAVWLEALKYLQKYHPKLSK